MLRGGRPKDPIWEHFNLIEDASKKTAQCKYCLNIQSNKVHRMKDHRAQADPFPATFFQPAAQEMKLTTWWTAVKASMDLPQGFLDLMLQLHSACASSASLERVFSSFGLVQSKLRNRLGMQKAQKLVFCYRMLRGVSELDY